MKADHASWTLECNIWHIRWVHLYTILVGQRLWFHLLTCGTSVMWRWYKHAFCWKFSLFSKL